MGRNRQNKFREAIPIPPPAPLPEAEEIDVKSVFNEYVSGSIDLIVVLGPTASGKTRYAVELARQLGGMVPSATVATLGHVRGGTADVVGGGVREADVERGVNAAGETKRWKSMRSKASSSSVSRLNDSSEHSEISTIVSPGPAA